MMKTRLMAEAPGEIEFTLKITMKANEWEQLRDQLSHAYPSSWQLTSAIDDLLSKARKVFYPEESE